MSNAISGNSTEANSPQKLGPNHRVLNSYWQSLKYIVSFCTIIVSITGVFGIPIAGKTLYPIAYLGLLVALALPLVFICIPFSKKSPIEYVPWYDVILAVIAFIGPFLIFYFGDDICEKGWVVLAPKWMTYLGLITWIIFLEAVRRISNLTMFLVIGIFSIYPLFANMLPGLLTGPQLTLTRVINYYYISDSGLWGFLMGIQGKTIIGYLVFAATITKIGNERFFMDFALGIVGRLRGGTTKVAILSSAAMASLSGSVVANVVSTGTFTIPAMKKSGYPPYYAGAIESVASTGGVFTPPVMGSVAFLMAEFLGIGYIDVCLAAIVPAILYYTSLYIQADLFALKKGVKGLKKEQIPRLLTTLKDGWPFIAAIVLLTYFIWMRVPGRAPYFASIAFMAVNFLKKEERRQIIPKFLKFLDHFANLSRDLSPLMSAIGLILGSLTITGLAHGFSAILTAISGGSVLTLLLLAAAASFVMGMGMSMAGCYVFLALLVVPALINLGVMPICAHLFIMYWGMVSYITPPVALGSIAAASIAGASIWKTGWQAVRLGFVAFVIPFLFVYNPSIIGQGNISDTFVNFSFAVAGIVMLSAMMEGAMYGVGKVNSLIGRIFLGVSGAILLFPFKVYLWNLVGIILAVLCIILLRFIQKVPSTPKAIDSH